MYLISTDVFIIFSWFNDSMSDREVLFIFHYDGDFEFDISCPVYNGGKQKMRFLVTNITYEALVKETIEASNLDSSI